MLSLEREKLQEETYGKHGFKFSTLLYKAFKCITLDEDSSDSLINIYKMTENLKIVEKWLSSINA